MRVRRETCEIHFPIEADHGLMRANQTIRRCVALLASNLSLLSSAAAPGHDWSFVPLRTDTGCIYYVGVLKGNETQTKRTYRSATWSGRCEPGKAISGHGALRMELREDGKDWWKSSEGQFVDGVPTGVQLQKSTYDAGGTRAQWVRGCTADSLTDNGFRSACQPRSGSATEAAATSSNQRSIPADTSAPTPDRSPAVQPSKVPGSDNNQRSIAERLRELAQIHREGLIDATEYEARRKKILDSL